MAAWVLPAMCVIGLVHVVFSVALAAARWQRAGGVRRSGTDVL